MTTVCSEGTSSSSLLKRFVGRVAAAVVTHLTTQGYEKEVGAMTSVKSKCDTCSSK